jgi:hypothetical protein
VGSQILESFGLSPEKFQYGYMEIVLLWCSPFDQFISVNSIPYVSFCIPIMLAQLASEKHSAPLPARRSMQYRAQNIKSTGIQEGQ